MIRLLAVFGSDMMLRNVIYQQVDDSVKEMFLTEHDIKPQDKFGTWRSGWQNSCLENRMT